VGQEGARAPGAYGGGAIIFGDGLFYVCFHFLIRFCLRYATKNPGSALASRDSAGMMADSGGGLVGGLRVRQSAEAHHGCEHGTVQHRNRAISFDFLLSGLYRRPWLCTRSCLAARGLGLRLTADRELHPALKVIDIRLLYLVYGEVC
jgi:hypothetical protein